MQNMAILREAMVRLGEKWENKIIKHMRSEMTKW